jgi:hypothetical protein
LSLVTAAAIFWQIVNHARSERPWILLSIADEQLDLMDGTTNFFPVAYWKVKNFGKTPALIETITGAVTVVDDTKGVQRLNFVAPDDMSFEPVIAPGQESSYAFFKMKTPISKEIGVDLIAKNPNHFLVMAGCIKYKDPFGTRHRTTFCYSFVYGDSEQRGFNRICGPSDYNQCR